MKKFVLCALSLFCILCGAFGFAACVTEEKAGTEGLQYQMRKDADGDYAAVVGLGTAIDVDIVIPSVYLDLPVKEIGESAFSAQADARNAALASISIPESVTIIGESAFYDCDGLTSVTVPDSVTDVGAFAFYDCGKLTSVRIGSGVTEMKWSAFSECPALETIDVDEKNQSYSSRDGVLYDSAQTQIILVPQAIKGAVTVPDGVAAIGSEFAHCEGLTSIAIGSGMTEEITWASFDGCTALGKFTVGADNPIYSSREGVLYNKAQTQIILVPQAIKGAVTIPDGVTSLGASFAHCEGLTAITISDSVAAIGNSAFYGCKGLTSVTIGSGVTSIGYEAFCGCDSLRSVIFRDPHGWSCSGNAIDPSRLQDPAIAAEHLSETYCYNRWTKTSA